MLFDKNFFPLFAKKGHKQYIEDLDGNKYVDFINGLVCRKGIESGVPTPANDAAVEFVKRLEKGELSPDPVNVVRLESHMAT